MSRPPLEVADIVRCAGESFIKRSRKWISWQNQKVLLAISRCRTAALGGHRDQCVDCGHSAISYNSCRNRHCPKCQGNARLHWLQARERELLSTSYVHVVFTLPRELAPLALQNKRLIYNLLFHASAPPRKRQQPPHRETNPIVPRGGFLQVAVSEAPLYSFSTPSSSLGGASDTALRLIITNPPNFLEASSRTTAVLSAARLG